METDHCRGTKQGTLAKSLKSKTVLSIIGQGHFIKNEVYSKTTENLFWLTSNIYYKSIV